MDESSLLSIVIGVVVIVMVGGMGLVMSRPAGPWQRTGSPG